jgi:hypothetical protein
MYKELLKLNNMKTKSEIKKPTKGLNQYLTKEDIQVTRKMLSIICHWEKQN